MSDAAPSESPLISHEQLLTLTTEIVSAHVSHNHVPTSDLAATIQTVYLQLSGLQTPADEPAEPPTSAVPIKKSITNDYLVCLEDGKKLKMLKRHLSSAYNMTPDEYRAKWGLPHDYPMVAPAYAKKRQELAKKIGLGRRTKPAPKPRSKKK